MTFLESGAQAIKEILEARHPGRTFHVSFDHVEITPNNLHTLPNRNLTAPANTPNNNPVEKAA